MFIFALVVSFIIVFDRRLKELRLINKLTQQELANLLFVSKSTICSYEKGKRMASIDTLIKISNIFNVNIDYLVGYKSAKVTKEDVIVNILYEEYEMIKELRKYSKLYSLIINNPKRVIALLEKRII
jgi:transcriptional regulator with XRE-family HTH domain